MRTLMKSFALWSLLAGVALSAGAAELKKVVILNIPEDSVRASEAQHVIKGLEQAGFKDGEQIEITHIFLKNVEEDVAAVKSLNPALVIDVSNKQAVSEHLYGASFPVICTIINPQHVDAQGVPTGNLSGIYPMLQDMVYHSYKFLRLAAPLKPGQQAVFLEIRQINLISKEAATDALQRLNIPLKAVVDATVHEDWQAAVRQYNDDPEVGWILMGVFPFIKRDGTAPNRDVELAQWLREHVKKPMVTYWESAVRSAFLCGLSVDLDDVGLQAGEMAARVLNGEDIKTIKAEYPRKTLVVLNRKTADFMGITFSLDVLNLAQVIYHDWEGKEVSRKSGLK